MKRISNFFYKAHLSLKLKLYRAFYIPFRAAQIRKKDKITVVFPIWNLSMWKTESLYKAMLSHPRFNPHLILGYKLIKSDLDELINYCDAKKYDYYIKEDVTKNLWEPLHPDIIFLQQPYESEFFYNPKSLFCYAPYAFHNSILSNAIKTNLILNCWQTYYENKRLYNEYKKITGVKNFNGYATGIPSMDELIVLKKEIEYKNDNKFPKTIIYAPHHSFTPENWWQTSSFLETGELMLEIAEKYSEKIYWIFKPHPVLKKNLEIIWGKEKTENYYNKWSNNTWSRYENGPYMQIFKESDAMIHDCGSFIIEYMTTDKPVFYLLRQNEANNPWNSLFIEAYNLHYKGRTKEQIENFIIDVIEGVDSMKGERQNFFKGNLTPPYNRTACENIIDCILSKDAKKKYR